MDSIYSIKTTDLHYVFSGLECTALVVLILVLALNVVKKPALLEKAHKTIILIFALALAVGIAGAYITNLYNYLHYTRPGYIKLNNQIRRSQTGL